MIYRYKPGGHHHRKGPKKFNYRDDKFYKRNSGTDDFPHMNKPKLSNKEYKDLDDPTKNSEQISKNIVLINYNDI